jgi:hypothetical protein
MTNVSQLVNERPRPLDGTHLAVLGVVAAALHAAFDAATARWAATTPPYLRSADMPEAFQALSPMAISVAASCVSGVIAVVAFVATAQARRRRVVLGATITGFWLLSAALMRLVWLDTPWSITAVGLLAGVPRGFAIGAVLDALARVPGRAHAARPRS